MASPLPSDPRGQRIGQRQNQQRPGNHRAVGPEEPHDDGQGDGRQHDSVVPRPPAMAVRWRRSKTVTEPRCRTRQISFATPSCSRRAAAAVGTIQAPSTTDPTHNAGRYATGYVTPTQARGTAATRYATAAMRVARAGPYRTAVVVLPPAASLSTSRMSFTNISARPM